MESDLCSQGRLLWKFLSLLSVSVRHLPIHKRLWVSSIHGPQFESGISLFALPLCIHTSLSL